MKVVSCSGIAVLLLIGFGSFCESTSGSNDISKPPFSSQFRGKEKKKSKQQILKKRNNQSNKQQNPESDQYGGTYFEVGLTAGQKKTSAESRDFADSPGSVNAFEYGGDVALGYIGNISGNFYAGINAGVDGVFSRGKMWRGGHLDSDSSIRLSSERNFARNRAVLNSLLKSISRRFSLGEGVYSINQDRFEEAINFCHWLGSKSVQNLDYTTWVKEGNCNGALLQQIERLGSEYAGSNENKLQTGLVILKDFSIKYFSTVSTSLENIAHRGYDVFDENGHSYIEVNDEYKDLKKKGARLIELFFFGNPNKQNNRYYYKSTATLDHASQLFPKDTFKEDPALTDNENLIPDQKQLSYALKAIDDLYYNVDDADENLRYYRTLHDEDDSGTPETQANTNSNSSYKFHSKTTFNLCPHISLQLGYFVKEFGGILYTKLGAMQLNGRTTIATDVADVYTEKFHKWTPYAALGFNKSISEVWGVSVEVGHAFKTSKKFNIKYGNDVIKEKISVSRTMFRVLLTCNLGSLLEL